MLKFVSLFLFIDSGLCVIFDVADMYDPFSFFWNKGIKSPFNANFRCKNGETVGECMSTPRCVFFGGTVGSYCGRTGYCCTFPEKTQECKVTTYGKEKVGTCMNGKLCFNSGGTAKGGGCGLFEKCCVYDNTCERTTTAKVSYFEGNYLKAADQPTSCIYTVYFENPHVCQVRLDFDSFSLMTAESDPLSSLISCRKDVLTIEPNHYGIPSLCGTNNNNHVYVHLVPGDEKISLSLKLTKRNDGATTELPHWVIKVTQLQCGGHKTDYDTSVSDFRLLAPRGAIQYYTEPSGVIKSFGYDRSYTSGEAYAIAIKKDPGYCGAQFIPSDVNMANKVYPPLKDDDCIDYLNILGLSVNDSDVTYNTVAKTCASLITTTLKAVTPGQLYFTFTSTTPTTATIASQTVFPFFYKYQYKLITSC